MLSQIWMTRKFADHLLWKMDVEEFFRNFRILSSCSDFFRRLTDTVRRIRDNCVEELSFLSPESESLNTRLKASIAISVQPTPCDECLWFLNTSRMLLFSKFFVQFLKFSPRWSSWVGNNQINVMALKAILFKIAWKKGWINSIYDVTLLTIM